jgi:hypothetical protein
MEFQALTTAKVMDWRGWFYGLSHAAIAGAANSVTGIITAPDRFNLSSWNGFEHVLAMAGVGAFVGFWIYLKQAPLPEWSGDDRRKDVPNG